MMAVTIRCYEIRMFYNTAILEHLFSHSSRMNTDNKVPVFFMQSMHGAL
jgi:hypothetical protein